MSPILDRLLRPRTIAVLGGAWARNVIEQCQRMGFAGRIWPVHPRLEAVLGLRCYPSLAALPGVPDASFIGIDRFKTIAAVAELSAMDAGGAVCFASGFNEAAAEDVDAAALHGQLLAAAGGMPVLGPNCYGLINYLDGVPLWPDQHGGERVARGVALVTQSSNIAINLTMQRRGLPIAYLLTAGNQAQLSLGQLAAAVLEDERVTALGLYIEGFNDIAAFELMAARARTLGKPVVAVKAGRSAQARQAMVSHTNSLSGNDAAATAFLDRLGIARVESLPVLLETLKLLHSVGPLAGVSVQSLSCSGGEAGLMADAAADTPIVFPPLNETQRRALRAALGPLVALANPLDYHTFIWDDLPAMTAVFTALLRGSAAISLLVLDLPREDRCQASSWYTAIAALTAARDATGARVGVVATLAENMPEALAETLLQSGIVPLCGIDDALAAIAAAGAIGAALQQPPPAATLALVAPAAAPIVLTEAAAKDLLKDYALPLPASRQVSQVAALPAALERLSFPVVLKGTGLAHKTEAQAVKLNLKSVDEVLAAAADMQARVGGFLLEEFIDDVVAELLVGIVRDPAHGLLLTLAAGGVLAELTHDVAHLLLPVDAAAVERALASLTIAPLLNGFRGRPAACRSAIVSAVLALQRFALDHADRLYELEINPLLCGPRGAVAADALISLADNRS